MSLPKRLSTKSLKPERVLSGLYFSFIVIAAMLWFSVGAVQAQLQTGSTGPSTRNPQGSTPQLFEQQETPQSNSSQQLLNNQAQQKIKLPQGAPIQSQDHEDDQQEPGINQRWLILGLILSLIMAGVFYRLAKQSAKSPTEPEAAPSPIATQTFPEATTPIPTSKPKNKNLSRKGKKKKSPKKRPKK